MTTATVLVPRQRLPRWLDNFARHHGEPVATLRTGDGDDDRDVLELRSPDGAVARVLIPYGPVPVSDDPRAGVLAHLAVDRTVGVLLARRGGSTPTRSEEPTSGLKSRFTPVCPTLPQQQKHQV